MSATTNSETVNQTAPASAPAVDANGASSTGAGENGDSGAAVAKKELQGHRIHIGNLPFKATEEEVRALASKANVEILEVVIPQRFGRPAGYAFVALKTEEDSKKVLDALADEEIEGRKIKLQVARSPEEQAERRAEVTEKRKAEKEAAKAEKAKLAAEKKAAEGGDAAAAEGAGEAGTVKSKKKRASKKGPRRRVPGDEDEEAEGEANGAAEADSPAPATNGETKTAKPKKKKSSKSKKAQEARIDGGTTEGGEAAAPAAADAAQVKEPKEKKEKKLKKPRQVPTGEPSSNTVFVANLPFEVDDEALAAIFTNLSIRVTSAKVVTGVRRNREGRAFRGSRGFGFVEVEDASQQKEAVEKVEGTLIGDRKLSAKIANEMKEAEAEEAAQEAQKSDAAATAAPDVTSATTA